MSLKVELKPNERLIIGDVVIYNQNSRAKLVIEGQAPILREKDILTPDEANTPAKRIYLAIQTMYLQNSFDSSSQIYLDLVHDFVQAVPRSADLICNIGELVVSGQYYKALKETKNLIELEKGILNP